MNKLVKKIIGFITTAAALGFAAAAPGALPADFAEAVPTLSAPVSADPFMISGWDGLQTALSGGYDSIKLTDEITAPTVSSYLSVPAGKTVILDLNGHTIDRGLENEDAQENGYVIKVLGSLTIKDSSSGGTGKITGGNNAGDGGGIYVGKNASLTLKGGAITGNKVSAGHNGGGVYVLGGTFAMSGGEISKNTANLDSDYNGGRGGGVYLQCYVDNEGETDGTFIMNGGTISGNTAENGGGVNLTDSTFTMSGTASITGNNAADGAGGVYVSSGSFTMNGGTISGNTAQYNGGGVYVCEGSFTMNGGTISGNSITDNYGGGVYVCDGSFSVSGSARVTGNQKGGSFNEGVLSGGTDNNVYLSSGEKITVRGALTEDAEIGVTCANWSVAFIEGYTDTENTENSYALTEADASRFTSDNDKSLIRVDNSLRFADWYGLSSAMTSGSTSKDNPTVIKLFGDIKAGENDYVLTVSSGSYVTLDLNGHTLDRGLAKKSAVTYGNIINVAGSLTLKDSSATDKDPGTGKLTGGNNSDATSSTGGVCVSGSTASFTMDGGTISGNTAKNRGGGVHVLSGSFTMNGGTISGNTAKNYGGGVYVSSGSFTMNGGTISGNTAKNDGGGVYISNGSFSVIGSARVTGNKKGGTDNNVYLSSGKIITVRGALTEDAAFGVTCADWNATSVEGYTDTENTENSYAPTDADLSRFMGDDGKVPVSVDGNFFLVDWSALSGKIDAASMNKDNPTVIKLLGDINAGESDTCLTAAEGKYISLELNGHTLDRGLSGKTAKDDGCVIKVLGSLNVKDSTDDPTTLACDGTGKITGGNNTENGGGIYSSGSLYIDGVTFDGNSTNKKGGAIYNYEGTLKIKNSKFDKNTSGTNSSKLYYYSIYNYAEETKLFRLTIINTDMIEDMVAANYYYNNEDHERILDDGTKNDIDLFTTEFNVSIPKVTCEGTPVSFGINGIDPDFSGKLVNTIPNTQFDHFYNVVNGEANWTYELPINKYTARLYNYLSLTEEAFDRTDRKPYAEIDFWVAAENSMAALYDKMKKAENKNLKLDRDYIYYYGSSDLPGIEIEEAFTLDLNGHTIDGKNTSPIFKIKSGGFLTIKDSSEAHTGTIKNGKGEGVSVYHNGNTGQYFTGGAVYVGKGGKFTLSGGTITDCSAANDIGSNGLGGAVFVNYGGEFIMTGGAITDCTAGTNGGAVYVYYDPDNENDPTTFGKFTMTGGTINGEVYVCGVMEVSGSPVIDAVKLIEGRTISVTGSLGGNASVKVAENSMTTAFAEGSGYTLSPSDAEKFTNASGGLRGMLNDGGKAVFAHEHTFSYSASGDTLTAACAYPDVCGLSEAKATLKIKAPLHTTYADGKTASATLTGDTALLGSPGITYKKGTVNLGSAPVNAGTYRAEITLGEVSAYVDYTIAPASVTVSGITANGKTYDGKTDAELVFDNVAFSGKLDEDTLTVTATGTFNNANVGKNKSVTISSLTLGGKSADNYALAKDGQQKQTTADISTADVSDPTVTLSYTSAEYDGTEKKPAVKSVKLGDTVIPDTEYTVSYSDNTDAGTATVTITDNEGGNYDVSGSATFTISQAAYSGTKTATGSAVFGKSGEVELSELVCLGGTLGTPATKSTFFDGKPALSGKKLTYTFKKDKANAGEKAVVTIPVTSKNYKDYEITVTLTVSACKHESTTLTDAKEPTCEEKGYTGDKICDWCGETVEKGKDTDPLGHKEAAAVKEKITEATCAKEGSYDLVVYCERCHKELSRETVTLAKLAHTPGELTGVKAATCEGKGYTGDIKCTVCGETLEQGKETAALGHTRGKSEKQNEIPATEDKAGSYELVTFCAVCGDEISRETITVPKLDHTHTAGEPVKENETAATCTVDGGYDLVTYCTTCHYEMNRVHVTVKATGHTPGALTGAKEATCTEDGYTGDRNCTVCGETLEKGKVIPALGHVTGKTEKINETAATCAKEGGYEVVTYCANCGEVISRETKTIAKLAHTAGTPKKENTVPATEEKDGSYEEVVRCTVCGEEISRRTVTIPHGEHTHKAAAPVRENEVAPTCAEEGRYDEVTYCETCGAQIKRVTVAVAKLAHTAADSVKENEIKATCLTEGGYDEVTYCEVCHEELNRQFTHVAKLGHKAGEAVKENVKAAGCTADGGYDEAVYCERCGNELERKHVIVPKTGHDFKDGVCALCGLSEIKGISVSEPKKIAYLVGDTLDLTGAEVRVTYHDNSQKAIEVTTDMVSGYDPATEGKQTVTVTYGAYKDSFDILLEKKVEPTKEIKSIKVATEPTKKVYYTGETLDLTGGVLAVNYTDGTDEKIELAYQMISGYNSDKTGSQKLTVTYGGKTTTFKVKVKSLKVSSVKVAEAPYKTEYFVGDTLDLTGGLLEIQYADGETDKISMLAEGVNVTGFNSKKAGVQKLTVKFGGKKAELTVNVGYEPDTMPVHVRTAGYQSIDEALSAIKEPGEYEIRITDDYSGTKKLTTPKIDGVKTAITVAEGKTLTLKGLTVKGDVTLTGNIAGGKLTIDVEKGAKLTLNAAISAKELKLEGEDNSALVIGTSLTVKEVSGFTTVDTGAATLTVTGKTEDIGKFNGRLVAGSKTELTEVGEAFLTIPAKNVDKTSVKTIAGSLTVTIDGELKNGGKLFDYEGKDFDGGKVTITNTVGGEKLDAFLAKKGAVVAKVNGAVSLNGKLYPDVETAIAAMTDTNTDYVLTLNKAEVKAGKLTIPAKLKSVTIRANANMTATLVTDKLTAKSPLVLENCTVTGSVIAAKLTVNGDVTVGKSVTVNELNSTVEDTKLTLAELKIKKNGVSEGSEVITLYFPGKTFKANDTVVKTYKDSKTKEKTYTVTLLKLDEANGTGTLKFSKNKLVLE